MQRYKKKRIPQLRYPFFCDSYENSPIIDQALVDGVVERK